MGYVAHYEGQKRVGESIGYHKFAEIGEEHLGLGTAQLGLIAEPGVLEQLLARRPLIWVHLEHHFYEFF